MNYLCHGRALLDDPLSLAGAALPDWLRAAQRRARVRRGGAEAIAAGGGEAAAVARGALRHLEDDRWFHATDAFAEVTGVLTRRLRAAYPGTRLRASFLAHVLLEMLLDAALDARGEVTFERYYGALDRLSLRPLARVAEELVGAPLPRFVPLVQRFLDARFLFGYREDEALLLRLGGLCRRVGLPPLPPDLVDLLPPARALVMERADELLAQPAS